MRACKQIIATLRLVIFIRLPPDAADWFDTLKQECPPQEFVDKALKNFDDLSCANVGQFLSHYLTRKIYWTGREFVLLTDPLSCAVDVKLLGRAIILYFEAMAKVIGVHPVDVAKYSASSFSSHAVQLFLYQNKRVACFSPDVKTL